MPDSQNNGGRRTRPVGAHPRPQRPRPPSTRPPSSASTAARQPHEVFVQIANLQMAKARQQRIRASLQTQVDRCTAEIDRLDAEIRRRFDQVGLQQKDDDTPSTDGGFQYDY